MHECLRLLPAIALCATTLPALAGGDIDTRLLDIEHQWAQIAYRTPAGDKEAALTQLESQAAKLAARYPQRAEPKVWEAIVISTHAGVHGGLGALSMVRKARDLLLAAQAQDPGTLHGSIYTSLGSLYYQVPGWPLGFGDDDKAEVYLNKALALNPDGIDPNYFEGDYLYHRGRYRQALAALKKALAAPPRPDRPLADQGRRRDVQALIAKIQSKG
jgi:tetratricopeptide (TPR) repeat protein